MLSSGWDRIKNDIGWIIGILLLVLTQIQPFLNWVSSRRGTVASAKKDEASASAEMINADSNRTQTMAQSAQLVAETATEMMSQAQQRLLEVQRINESLNSRILELTAEISKCRVIQDRLSQDIERLRVALNDTELFSRKYHARASEALGVIWNVKHKFPWAMEGVCPPDEDRENLWLTGIEPLENNCDDTRKSTADSMAETKERPAISPDNQDRR